MDIGCMGLNRRSLRPNRPGFQIHSDIIVKHLFLHPLTDFHRLRTIITGFTRLAKFAPVLKVPNSVVFEPYLGNEVEFRKSKKKAPRCPTLEDLCKISAQSVHWSKFYTWWQRKKKNHENSSGTIVGNLRFPTTRKGPVKARVWETQ